MTRQRLRLVATLLSIIAAIAFIAPTFGILPRNIGIFIGIALTLTAGAAWGSLNRAQE